MAKQDAPIWTDRLKAANPDDFDPIIQRVARNIGTREKATSDQDIYNVTENETKLPKRKKVNSYFGIGIGGMVPLSPVVEMTPGVNLFGMYDTQTLLIGLDANFWGMGTDNRYSYADIGISIHYPFGRKFIAPYIGGGLTYYLNTFILNQPFTKKVVGDTYNSMVNEVLSDPLALVSNPNAGADLGNKVSETLVENLQDAALEEGLKQSIGGHILVGLRAKLPIIPIAAYANFKYYFGGDYPEEIDPGHMAAEVGVGFAL